MLNEQGIQNKHWHGSVYDDVTCLLCPNGNVVAMNMENLRHDIVE